MRQPSAPTPRQLDLLLVALDAGVTSPLELANFMAQIGHESAGLRRLEESFRYTGGIRQIPVASAWRRGEAALRRAHREALRGRPGRLAALMYGGRMGNDEGTDGYRYRGRGYIQLTGRDNYARAGEALGIDLLADPGLAARPDVAARVAVWYWQQHVPQWAREDVLSATRAINGGTIGLADRRARYGRWLNLLTPDFLASLAATGRSGQLASLPPVTTLEHGDRGADVRWLQARLNAHGARGIGRRPLPLSGNYLDNTRAAVRAFQQRHGLPVSGVADGNTLAALALASDALASVEARAREERTGSASQPPDTPPQAGPEAAAGS